MSKLKTYVLMFSSVFPNSHPRAGEPTFFVVKIARFQKKHTIRKNASLWKKRIEEVQRGEAELSLRYWEGKPYRSHQIEFGRLGKEEGVNYQIVNFNGDITTPTINHWIQPNADEVAKNDGLSFDDWADWFECYDLNEDMIIINLCNFQYYEEIH